MLRNSWDTQQGSSSGIRPNTSLSILYGGQGSINKPSDKPGEWILKETKGDPEASHAARCRHLTTEKELESHGVWRHKSPDQQGAQIRGKTWKVWAWKEKYAWEGK